MRSSYDRISAGVPGPIVAYVGSRASPYDASVIVSYLAPALHRLGRVEDRGEIRESFTLFGTSPLDRLMSFLGLGGYSTRQMLKRVLFWIALTWVPLLVLSVAVRVSSSVIPDVPFTGDFAIHIRFLVALPLLILAERRVQRFMDYTTPLFLRRQLIPAESLSRFMRIKAQVENGKKSPGAELGLLLFAFGTVLSQTLFDLPRQVITWRTLGSGASVLAHAYTVWVGFVVYQFFILRWLWTFLLWAFFLLRVSKLKLSLNSHHPDQLGGLSFLNVLHLQFAVIPLVTSIVISGNVTKMVVYGGLSVETFHSPLLAYMIAVVILFGAPLIAFTPMLVRSRRRGLWEYGEFAMRYVNLFDAKWLESRKPQDPLGASDIQSLNDLEGSFRGMRDMRVFLLSRRLLIGTIAIPLFPLLPLVLFKIPLASLLKTLAKTMI